MPRVRMSTQAVTAAEPFGVLHETEIESAVVQAEPIELGSGEPGEAVQPKGTPGRLLVRTKADSEQLLVISASHHGGMAGDGSRRA